MPAPQPKVNDKVRFTYEGSVKDGKITQFMIASQQAVIDVKGLGTVVVPISDIIRVL